MSVMSEPVPAAARCQRPRSDAELVVAADERRSRRGVELALELGGGRLDVEVGVLAQDRVVQAAQLRRRLHADLVDERLARMAICLERLGLAPAAVEGEHPLGMQPLPERVVREQRVDLADDLLVAAGGQVGVDRQLGGSQAKLLEPPDLGSGERLVGDVRERLAAEQREGRPRRVPVVAVPGRVRRLGDQPLEAVRVHLLAVDPQLIRAPARDDHGAAVVVQQLAQPPDVVLDHLGGAGRGLSSPTDPRSAGRR